MPEHVALSLILWAALAGALAVTELVFARRGRHDDPHARASDLLTISATIVALVAPGGAALAGLAASDPVTTAIGCGLALVGLVLRTLAMVGLHGRYRLTPQAEPDAGFLVSGGVYGFVRHPGYLALVCVVSGLALVACGALGLLAVPPMVAAAMLRIAGEERILSAEFGEQYARYRARVSWRLMPWLY
jgi:protein-S-isoprenylcysteine O-methyltransferase Ste14